MIHTVLIIDNNPVILKMLTGVLEEEGYQVKTALDGLSAFDLILHSPPDIIFLDLIMPNINGEQLCQIIGDYEHLKDIPIVLISGIAAEAEQECMVRGASACLAKGPELSRNVLELVEHFNRGQGPADIPAELLGKEELHPREISLELLEANRHLQIIMENMSDGILEINPQMRIIFANQAASRLTGIRRKNLLAGNFLTLPFEGAGQKRLQDVFLNEHEAGVIIGERETLSINGHLVRLQVLPVQDREGQTTIAIIKDITARKKAEQQIRQSRQYLQAVLNSVQAGILVTDTRTCKVVDGNPLALKMLAIPESELEGRGCHEGDSCPAGEGGCPVIEQDSIGQTMVKTIVNDKGKQIDVLKTTTPCQIGDKSYVVESFIDISEQKRLEEKLHSLTITDELTGLLNRRGFMMMARKQLSIADRAGYNLFLVFADLDDLKVINDTYGHEAGDRVLSKVGEVLKALRSSDISGRIGGDEFALLVTGDQDEQDRENLVSRLQELFEGINREIGLETRVSLSMGIVEYRTGQEAGLEELLAKADSLMYRDKLGKKDG